MSRPRSTEQSLFRYCPMCGSKTKRDREGRFLRSVCGACGYVQYRNPIVGVAAVIEENEVIRVIGEEAILAATGQPAVRGAGRVLFARRAITYRGCYCLPCGYVEYDEEIREALVREIEEETGLIIEPGRIAAAYSNFHEPDKQSVGIWFHATPTGGTLRAGDDVDALLFASVPDPGVPLAFPTDAQVLLDLSRRPDRGMQDS
jgi:ADP-ribose pyrophosphatase YjhB (NUDIX family)